MSNAKLVRLKGSHCNGKWAQIPSDAYEPSRSMLSCSAPLGSSPVRLFCSEAYIWRYAEMIVMDDAVGASLDSD